MPEFFNSSLGFKLAIPHVAQEIVRFMKADSRRRYKIMIGTDSERLNDGHADFVTAVVVHRVGNGGRYFWRRAELGKFHTLRDRIIREVIVSLELGKEVLTELKKFSEPASEEHSELARPEFVERAGIPEWDFEIHADVGEHGPTKAMIQEVVGMIRAHNFEPITKPGSYAASNVADRHV